MRSLHIVHDVFQRLRGGLPPQGNCTFHVSAAASNQTVPVLLPTEMTQPNPPHINNFADAQSVNATQAFILGWDDFVGGTATAVNIPSNSLQANSNYSATIGFYHMLIVSNTTYITEAYRATATLFPLNMAGSVRPVVTNVVCSGGSCSFDLLTTAGQDLTVVSTTNCALPLGQWPTLLTTNSPGAPVHFIDPRPATGRVIVYGVRNGT